MGLAAHQRKLLGLFRSTYQVGGDDEAYIHKVAQSRDLEEGRRNIFLWRVWVLERTAVLTFNLLKRLCLAEEAVGVFMRQSNISPFRETQTPAFLEAMSGHPDSLVASVAQFELALLKVKQGDSGSYVVPWNHGEPLAILNSLARDVPFESSAGEGAYQILISGDLPSQFKVVSLGGTPIASASPHCSA